MELKNLQSEYKKALHKLLPPGRIWDWQAGGNGDKLLGLFAKGFSEIHKQADDIVGEAIEFHQKSVVDYTKKGIERFLATKGLEVKVSDCDFVPAEVGLATGCAVYSAQHQAILRINYQSNKVNLVDLKVAMEPYLSFILVIYKDETGADIDYHRDEFISAVAGGSVGDYAIEQDTSYIKVATNGVPFAWRADELQEYFDAEFQNTENYIYI